MPPAPLGWYYYPYPTYYTVSFKLAIYLPGLGWVGLTVIIGQISVCIELALNWLTENELGINDLSIMLN